MIDLQQIKDELFTRNVIAYASEPPEWAKAIAAIAANQQMTVAHVHIEHHVRRVQVLCGDELVAETVFEDGKSLPALQAYYRLEEIMGLRERE